MWFKLRILSQLLGLNHPSVSELIGRVKTIEIPRNLKTISFFPWTTKYENAIFKLGLHNPSKTNIQVKKWFSKYCSTPCQSSLISHPSVSLCGSHDLLCMCDQERHKAGSDDPAWQAREFVNK